MSVRIVNPQLHKPNTLGIQLGGQPPHSGANRSDQRTRLRRTGQLGLDEADQLGRRLRGVRLVELPSRVWRFQVTYRIGE